jgi:hypothetical protein
VIENQKKRYQLNKEEIKEYKQKHYEKNEEYYKQKAKKQYEENKDDPSYIEKRKRRMKKWRDKNKHVVLWRSILKTCMKRLNQEKKESTIDLLGYSPDELKNHLESNWLKNMSWENYGEWQVDHIRSVCTFDPETHPSVVNALFNLRPLWSTTRFVGDELVIGNLNRKKKSYGTCASLV